MINKLIRKIFGKKQPPSSPRKPVVLNPAQHGIDPKLVANSAVRVVRILQQAGYDAYIVGGAVRDLLLGEKPKDFDVATNATPEQVRRLFRRAFLIGRRDPQLQLPMRQPDQGDARDAPPFHRDLGRPAKTVREFRERH